MSTKLPDPISPQEIQDIHDDFGLTTCSSPAYGAYMRFVVQCRVNRAGSITDTVGFWSRLWRCDIAEARSIITELADRLPTRVLLRDGIATLKDPKQEKRIETRKMQAERAKKYRDNKRDGVSDDPVTVSRDLALYLLSATSDALSRRLVSTVNGSAPPILRLLRKGAGEGEIREVIDWLCGPNLKNEYAFDVQSGAALFNKWDRIRAAMKRAQAETYRSTLG